MVYLQNIVQLNISDVRFGLFYVLPIYYDCGMLIYRNTINYHNMYTYVRSSYNIFHPCVNNMLTLMTHVTLKYVLNYTKLQHSIVKLVADKIIYSKFVLLKNATITL